MNEIFKGIIMRICAISPFKSAASEEILQFLSTCTHDLVILPGIEKNHPTVDNISPVLRQGVSAFIEDGTNKNEAIPWLVSNSGRIRMPKQIFTNTKGMRARDLDNLQDVWIKRKFHIGSKNVSFIICGEINAFNVDATVKKKRKLPFEILVNPSHTPMGRWNFLGIKLKILSTNKVVIHVANNTLKYPLKSKSDVRIYVDKELMKRIVVGNIAISECEI